MKSLSSSAMAGSCRNMPQYSLNQFIGEVQYGLDLQARKGTESVPTQNLSIAYIGNGGQRVRCCSKTRTRETSVKVPKYMLSVTKEVLTLRH